jgi:tetratricopeptide (TPR) repeat protein
LVAIGFLHAAEPPLAPTHYNPQLPVQIEQAILKALAKQRADRYPTITDFITALRAPTMEQAQVLRAPEEEIPTVLSTRVPTLAQTNSPDVSQRSKEQWMQEGNTLRGLKRYQEALAAYEQAIHLDPNYALAYHGKGNALYHLKPLQEALAAYGQAIHLDPNLASAYNNKGHALEALGKTKPTQCATK